MDNAGAPLPYEALADHELPGRPCPVAATMALIGEKWSMLALREVFLGNHRFNDIARNTGAPRDRLAARLRALEAAGVLERREYSTAPARYSYHLTPAGKALSPVTARPRDVGQHLGARQRRARPTGITTTTSIWSRSAAPAASRCIHATRRYGCSSRAGTPRGPIGSAPTG